MSVYHEFEITVEADRGLQDGRIVTLGRDGEGGLAFNVHTKTLRDRQEWQEVRDALMLAGQQLGWH